MQQSQIWFSRQPPGLKDSAGRAWRQVTGAASGGFTAQALSQKMLSGVPAYDQNKSKHPSNGCGPTSGAMVLGYWDTHGYDKLQFDQDRPDGIDLMNDLYVDMGTTSIGTSPSMWLSGVRYHANSSHYSGNGSGFLYDTKYHFATASNSTAGGFWAPWDLAKLEIDNTRPFGLDISWDNGSVPNLTYNNHWVTGSGYMEDPATSSYYLNINNSWGGTDTINYYSYASGKDSLTTTAVRPAN